MSLEQAAHGSLVAMAKQGDQDAFVELVNRYRPKLWAVCVRITGDAYEAEDALQDALIAAWRGLHGFREEAMFSTWLYRIAANSALAASRRRPDVAEYRAQGINSGQDVAREVVGADRAQRALMTLPKVYRTTFVLRVYGDLTYADIAQHENIPVQTVRSRLSRAKALLQAALTDDSGP